MPSRIRKPLILIGLVVLGVFLWTLIAGSYQQRYELLQERYPNIPKEIVAFDTFLASTFIHPFAPVSSFISLMEDMTKNIESEVCMVNGRVLVKISNEQEVYTYGKDSLIDENGQEQKAFCMKKDDTEKEITFVLKNGETIKETVTIERFDGKTIMKRPNGFIVTLVK